VARLSIAAVWAANRLSLLAGWRSQPPEQIQKRRKNAFETSFTAPAQPPLLRTWLVERGHFGIALRGSRMPSTRRQASENSGMFGARTFMLVAAFFAGALVALGPSAAPAQTVDFSLNVFYATPSNVNSGGTWELVAKSSNFGLAGADIHLQNIATAVRRAPRGTVNGNDPAGFNIFISATFPNFTLGQAPIEPLGPGEQQGAFYGVGQFANGSPNYPAQPVGTISEGPSLTSLTALVDSPWANTPDPFGNAAWSTAARLLSGTFATNVTPAFAAGNSANVFTSLGTLTTFGNSELATSVSTIVRTNFVAATADYNHNGIVDAADYVIWRKQNGTSVPNGTGADGNSDGQVNTADYDFWRANFGNPAGSGSGANLSTGAVPEPMSGALFLIGAILMLFFGRKSSRRWVPAVVPAPAAVRSLDIVSVNNSKKR
jgi:hypothetical protein